MALRFLLAFAVLALLFRRRLLRASKRTLLYGAGLGVLLAALMILDMYALFIVLSGRCAQQCEPIALGVIQMAAGGIVCLVATCLFETPQLPTSGAGWASLAVLVLVCSVFGFAFQPVAQKYISEVQAGMTCALNPAFASIIGVFALGETLAPVGAIGAVLVFAALLASTVAGKNNNPESDTDR